jgi:hypothetical protein
MDQADSTCWTVLHEAAAGDRAARDQFAAWSAPMIRAYLAARWQGSPLIQELDDAVQEAFVECLRHGGVLEKAQSDRPGGFRAFLYGLLRNVALRFEQQWARCGARQASESAVVEEIAADEETLARVFDRAWAKAIMREAAARQAARAEQLGAAARRRCELLRLRFQEDLPIRAIAQRWRVEPAVLHHEYARARAEFCAALREVMRFHHPGSPEEVERACAELLELLG